MLHLSDNQQQVAESFLQSKSAALTGTAGAAAAVTPTEKLAGITGEWLSTHGLGLISYTEMIQIIGAMWVLCLIADRVLVGLRLVFGKR